MVIVRKLEYLVALAKERPEAVEESFLIDFVDSFGRILEAAVRPQAVNLSGPARLVCKVMRPPL